MIKIITISTGSSVAPSVNIGICLNDHNEKLWTIYQHLTEQYSIYFPYLAHCTNNLIMNYLLCSTCPKKK